MPLVILSIFPTAILAIYSAIKWVVTGKGDEDKEPGIFIFQDWAVGLPYKIKEFDDL